MKGVRVCLEHQLVIRRGDTVFINIVYGKAGHKTLPNAAVFVQVFHGGRTGHPAVEIAHHADRLGARGPHAKHHALLHAARFEVRAKKFLAFEIFALFE